ncbi:MAG: phosphoribosylformylglycinamidine cyclo-ligase [Bacteroidetes bacterium]|nr:MAG: phosphoribosylformylglycinamidine cyclo-ligase [Bacteroidota bacterium]
MSDAAKYELRGVSASKSEVHAAIEGLDQGLYPKAFCKILPDFAAGDPDYCTLMHADTAGTKPSLAYLYWRETGDLSVWEGIAQDALVMNLDDMACVGCIDNITISSTIGRNKRHIPGEVIKTIIQYTQRFADEMADLGVRLHLAGGETADVGDIVRTIDVGYTAFGRLPRKDLVINNIQAGHVIVGLASYGQASYEHAYNGGMGSNGLTSARHDVFSKYYAEHYPESYDPGLPAELVYTGSKRLTDSLTIDGQAIDLGKLMLSPTRTYLPVLKHVLAELRGRIGGIIHNTGGGQTKVIKFINQVKVIKDNLLPLPPLFQLIQQESNTAWREMYQVFNMGTRLEFYVAESDAQTIIDMAKAFSIDAQIIGRVEAAATPSVEVHSTQGVFVYQE